MRIYATLESTEGTFVGFVFETKGERRDWLRHLRSADYDIFMPRAADRQATMIEHNPLWDATPAALV